MSIAVSASAWGFITSTTTVVLPLASVIFPAASFGLSLTSFLISTPSLVLSAAGIFFSVAGLGLPPQSVDLSLYPSFLFSNSPLSCPFIFDRPRGNISIMLAFRSAPACFRISSFLVLPHALGYLTIYLVLALTGFPFPPLSLFDSLPSHLVPDLLFNSSLLFSPLALFSFLSHLSCPFFEPSFVSDMPVAGLLFLSLTLFPGFTVSAHCFASCNLRFDSVLELSLSPLFFSLLLLSTTLFLGPLILKLLQPPCDLGPNVFVTTHSSVPSFLFTPSLFPFRCLSSQLFLLEYRSPQLHFVIFC